MTAEKIPLYVKVIIRACRDHEIARLDAAMEGALRIRRLLGPTELQKQSYNTALRAVDETLADVAGISDKSLCPMCNAPLDSEVGDNTLILSCGCGYRLEETVPTEGDDEQSRDDGRTCA